MYKYSTNIIAWFQGYVNNLYGSHFTTIFITFTDSLSEKFEILEKLSTSIQELTKNLQSGNSGNKSKEQTESDAKLFDELREKMSTKEFAEQYENGLSHDWRTGKKPSWTKKRIC